MTALEVHQNSYEINQGDCSSYVIIALALITPFVPDLAPEGAGIRLCMASEHISQNGQELSS